MITSCSCFQIFKSRNVFVQSSVICFPFHVTNPQLMSVPRCGSLIVDLALKFNSTTKEQDVITTLNDAIKDGKLGDFNVSSINGARLDVKPTRGGTTTPTDVSSGGESS